MVFYVELDVWGDDPSEVGFAAPNGLALDVDGNVYVQTPIKARDGPVGT